MSPDQTHIFLASAAAERAGGARPLADDAHFGVIEDIITESRSGYERTWSSHRLHFLPYLLSLEDRHAKSTITTPEQLFHEAIALRDRGDVSEYRSRLHRAQARMEAGGDDVGWLRDLQRAKQAVQASLNVQDETPRVSARLLT